MAGRTTEGIQCLIQSIDSMLVLYISPKTTGKDLMSMVLKHHGIFEEHWFAIYFVDQRGNGRWLDPKKKIDLTTVRPFPETGAHFKFGIRYFPESSRVELIQDSVRIMFFKHEILRSVTDEDFEILPEHRALMVSAYGCLISREFPGMSPYEVIESKFFKLFPPHVIKCYNLTKQEWMDIIKPVVEIAMSQYYTEPIQQALDFLEESPMHGVTYFDIINKIGTHLLIGVDCYGMVICLPHDRINPKVAFTWAEVYSVAYSGKKFIIKSLNKGDPALVFKSKSTRQNDEMLALIAGNHMNYLSRRQICPDLESEAKIAQKAQEPFDIKRKEFEDKKIRETMYDKRLSSIIATGRVDEQDKIELVENYNNTVENLKKNIDIVIHEIEEVKQETTEKVGVVEIKPINLNVSSEVLDESANLAVENKTNIALVGKEQEIEKLKEELNLLEIKHQEHMKDLAEIETKNPQISEGMVAEILNQKIKPITYAELKRKKTEEIYKTLKVATQTFKKATLKKRKDDNLRDFTELDQGKYSSLKKLIRQNNTRCRIDQFEAL